MKPFLTICIVIFAVFGLWSQTIVPDDNFRDAINAKLGQPVGYDPTIADLNSITGLLDAGDEGILSIEGAQYLTNLDRLYIDDNQITDLSPVAGLINLERLFADGNQIVDIAPVAGLVNLSQLKLDNNNIVDLSAVATLTNLYYLDLAENLIVDISPLSTLITTKWIYLDNNQINEISALAGLTELKRLYLYNNQITDIYPLVQNSGLGSGDYLYLERYGLGNPLSVEALNVHIPILQSRGFSTLQYPISANLSAACYPVPERDYIDVAVGTGLQWQGNYNASYKVWLGEAADNLIYVGDGALVSGTTYSFSPTLALNSEYWWRIECVGTTETIWSGLWNFTTGINYILNANFVADYNNVYTGSNVQFTDLSTGTPTSWQWDFDNNGIADSNLQNPIYIYPAAGVYTVVLVVSDGSTSDTETKTDYITVTDFAAVQPSGNGTTISPYQIENLGNLLWVSENPTSWNKHFIQTADIDASSTINWNGGSGFSSIGNVTQYNLEFTGSYNGQDHIIDGLYINVNSGWVGLFGIVSSGCTISNLGVTNVNISGSGDCGGLVGLIHGGEITNCYTSGSVTASNVSAGGLVGGVYEASIISECHSSATVYSESSVGGLASTTSNGSIISKCYATGDVSGQEVVGGLIGASYDSDILDCYSSGTVIGELCIGGLVGYSNIGTINDCYSTGAVVGSYWFGGLLGDNYYTTITDSYWDVETSGQIISAGGEGKTTAEMMLPSTYNNWDFSTTWFMENGLNNGYPFLEDIEHFQPCWNGNGYNNMQIFISSANIKGVPLEIGDEIGVFDNGLCVGGGTITNISTFVIELIVSADDPLTPEIDGFIDGNPIEYQIWDNSGFILYTNVSASYSSGNGTFAPLANAVVDLEADDSIMSYPYISGWNIGSFNVIPFDYDMQNIMMPIMNTTLIKVQDERGNILSNLPGVGWYNNIGDMMHTEGYYINLSQNDNLDVPFNNYVVLPLDIPLIQGWNIMGFPYDGSIDAQEVVQSLITAGTLVKVLDESGAALLYDNMAGSWINEIGDMRGGKGYFINVNADCVLTFVEPTDFAANPRKSHNVSQPTGRETTHFIPVWQNNPFLPMNFYISSLQVGGITLEPADELAVFDGDLCVGTAQVGENDIISLIAATDDIITEDIVDGFINGNDFTFKFWDSSADTEYENFQIIIYGGDDVFVSQGTAQMTIEFLPTGTGGDLLPTVTAIRQNYPNPFNPETNIAFSMREAGHVTIEIFNVKGQKVTTLTNCEYEAGFYNLIWQARNDSGNKVGSGVYFYKFSVNGKTNNVKRMLLLK